MKRPRFALLAFVGTFLGLSALGVPPTQKGSAADPNRSDSSGYAYDGYGYDEYRYEDAAPVSSDATAPLTAPEVAAAAPAPDGNDAPQDDPLVAPASPEELDEYACDLCQQNHWPTPCGPQKLDHPCAAIEYHDECRMDPCADDRLARDLADLKLLHALADERHSYGNEEVFDINLEEEGLFPPLRRTGEIASTDELAAHGIICPLAAEYPQYAAQGEEAATNVSGNTGLASRSSDCDLEYLHYPGSTCPVGTGTTDEDGLLTPPAVSVQGTLIENNLLLDRLVRGLMELARQALEMSNWIQEQVRQRAVATPADEDAACADPLFEM